MYPKIREMLNDSTLSVELRVTLERWIKRDTLEAIKDAQMLLEALVYINDFAHGKVLER